MAERVLPGQSVRLRPAAPTDRRSVYEWAALSDLTAAMMGPPLYPDHPVPSWEAFCVDHGPHFFDGSDLMLGRCYIIEADGEPVGQIYYNDIEERAGARRVEIDLWLRAERYTGRGYGTDALETLCRHLSESLAVEVVMLQPSARNPRAIRAYEKVGFRRLALPLDEARALWGPNDYDDSVYMVKPLNTTAQVAQSGARPFADNRASYDAVADAYAREIYDELRDKPFDRAQLDRLAAAVGSRGVICDLGCGPGQIARYLADRGASVVGVDLSDGMLAQARRLNPDVVFQQGDMRALTTVRDGAWAGIAAFYSIIHIPRAQLTAALTELRRVLQPGGLLLLAFHLGQGELHLDTWWDRPVNAEFIYFQTAEMRQALEAAGFAILEAQEREPYADVEHPSRRAYILARRAE